MMGFLHSVYSTSLPLGFRIRFSHLLTHIGLSIRNFKYRCLLARLASDKRRQKQLAAIQGIRQQRPLRIAFQVCQLSKWKCESLLQLMMLDSRFKPVVWLLPVGGDIRYAPKELHAKEAARILEHFAGIGVQVVRYEDRYSFPPGEQPDIVFIHEPYNTLIDTAAFRGTGKEITCYVPYCFRNSTNAVEHNSIGNIAALFCFCENEAIRREAATVAANKGSNLFISGSPIADIFLAPETRNQAVWKQFDRSMKKVIWAPHWTIASNDGWFVCGTFLETYKTILTLVKKHVGDIQFAFKPHPKLYTTLCAHPNWGKEKTDKFYRLWNEMPNTQLAEGDYTALFMQSDAIIHDSGSFILEYLFADKPGLFLMKGAGYGDYNEMTIQALECYLKGITEEDIENFLQECVLGGKDPLRERRISIRREYILPPGNRSCAENIIHALLES